MDERPSGEPVRIHAVPWRTPTAEKVRGALGELPAYLRRAQRMEEAIREVTNAAERERARLLRPVARAVRRLLDFGDDGLSPAEAAARYAVAPLPSFARLKPRRPFGRRAAAAEALAAAVDRFHAERLRFLEANPFLAAANREIEGYNRWFELERQCALKYVPLDQVSFTPRAPLVLEDLVRAFPPLVPCAS